MRIFAISGSLRATSSNTALLKNLARAIPAPSAMHLFDGLGDLPPFNPDFDESAPDSVTAFRATVAAADVVAISTPEYAHGVPGVLKNALDWLVGSGELYRKPVALLHVSGRGEYARASLREILTIMGTAIVLDAVVTTKPSDGLDAIADTPELLEIEAAVNAMIQRIEEQAAS